MFSDEELGRIQQFKNDVMIELQRQIQLANFTHSSKDEYVRLVQESDAITTLLAREFGAQDRMLKAIQQRRS